MKIWLISFCLSFAVCANAQQGRFNNPIPRTGMPSFPSPQEQQNQDAQIAQRQIQDQIDNLNSEILSKSNALQQRLLLPFSERTNIAQRLKDLPEQKKRQLQDPWRKIDGKTVLVSGASGFTVYVGKILQTTPSGILLQSYMSLDMQHIFIKNFPYVYGDGTEIPSIEAVPCEPYSYTTVLGASERVNAADYGIPCSPPSNAEEIEAAAFRITPVEENAIKEDAYSALAEITNAQMELTTARKNLQDFFQKLEDERQAVLDERQAVLKAQEQKKKEVQDRVLKSNQDLADKGDAYGLLRMGEHYRDGDGVPKDLNKARDYLTKATAAGSPTATDELLKLNQVSTNAPANP